MPRGGKPGYGHAEHRHKGISQRKNQEPLPIVMIPISVITVPNHMKVTCRKKTFERLVADIAAHGINKHPVRVRFDWELQGGKLLTFCYGRQFLAGKREHPVVLDMDYEEDRAGWVPTFDTLQDALEYAKAFTPEKPNPIRRARVDAKKKWQLTLVYECGLEVIRACERLGITEIAAVIEPEISTAL